MALGMATLMLSMQPAADPASAGPFGQVERDIAADAVELRRRVGTRIADGVLTGAEARGRELVILIQLDDLLGEYDDVGRIQREKAREVCGAPSLRSLIERGGKLTYRGTAPDGAIREINVGSCEVPPEPVLLSGNITDADYPSEAIRAEAEGSVVARLVVARDGSVSECRIARSSGFAPLDAATCQLALQRFRFDPLPAPTGTQYRIIWRMPTESTGDG